MRIAVVAGFPPDSYGEAHHTGEVFGALARQYGTAVEVLVLAHRSAKAPADVKILPNLRVKRLTHPQSRLRTTLSLLRVFATIVRFRADVVHFEGVQTSKYGGLFGEPATLLMLALRSAGIPSVVTIHSLWLPEDLDAMWRGKGLSRLIGDWLTRYYGWHLRVLSRVAAVVNTLASGDKSEIGRRFLSGYGMRPRSHWDEVHPCVNQPVSDHRADEAKRALGLMGRRLVMAAGFVREDKGYHVLLESADAVLASRPDVVYIVAGEPISAADQAYSARLQTIHAGLRMRDRVTLNFASLDDDAFNTMLDAADIVVVPYLRVLGPSGPLHHGIGRGKTVIASAVGHNFGLRDVCRLTPAGSASALADAISELLDDPALAASYRSRAAAFAKSHTWDDLARQYMAEYRAVI